MAENKKSVLLYCDIIHTVEELDDADAGLLFKHYLRYINDQNPEPPSKLIKIVFEPIKQNLKRDLKKWDETIQSRSIAGKAGASARWQKMATDGKRIDSMAKMAVIDTVNVTVKENDIFINTEIFGSDSKYYCMVDKKYVHDRAIRINGPDGLAKYMEANQSVLNLPAYAEKFMRKNNGNKFNDFQHLFNAYNKFIENGNA